MPPEALGAKAPQQGLQAHIHTDQPDLVAHLGEIQVGGPDHLDLVGVHELVVEDVPGQQHLALTAVELAQVHPGGPQCDRAPVHMFDDRGIQVGMPAPHPDHQAGDRRVIVAAIHTGHQVDEAADLLARLVQHRGAVQADERDDVLPHLPGRRQAL